MRCGFVQSQMQWLLLNLHLEPPPPLRIGKQVIWHVRPLQQAIKPNPACGLSVLILVRMNPEDLRHTFHFTFAKMIGGACPRLSSPRPTLRIQDRHQALWPR